jgi:hypothetical protein
MIQAAIKDSARAQVKRGAVFCAALTSFQLSRGCELLSLSRKVRSAHTQDTPAARPPVRPSPSFLPSFIILVKGLAIIIHIIRLKPRAPTIFYTSLLQSLSSALCERSALRQPSAYQKSASFNFSHLIILYLFWHKGITPERATRDEN